MGRRPCCCSKEGMNRGAWTSMEDEVLTAYIKAHGEGNWRNLPKRAGLKRCGKSCRLRWLNYLRPDIKRGNISKDEEDLIHRLHRLLGNRWSLIAGRLPGRTDNEIKNYWNSNLRKKAKAKSQSSSSSETDKVTTQHQVIRTKATRCTRVMVPAPEPIRLAKNQEYHSISSTEMNPFELEECYQEPSCEVKMDQYGPQNHDSKEEFHQMSCDLGFLNSMDAHGQVLLMDEPYFGDWAVNSCPQDEISAGLDLESLAFLLDSSEWPLQENQ